MRKLTIDFQLADLSNDTIIALSKSINDFWDLKDKRSNLTNTFILPYSQANNAIFKNAKDITITENPRNYYEVSYIQDFVQVIGYGKGKLIKASKDGYEFCVYWGNIDISEILGTKTLQDLELSDLNHIWNHANVIALICPAPAPVFDVLYPFYNPSAVGYDMWALGTSPDPFFSQNFIPFVRLERIINQIETDNDFVFTGGIENTDSMAYIPVAFNDFNPDYNVEASFVQMDLTGTPDLTLLTGFYSNQLPLIYDNIILDKLGLISLTTGYYQFQENGNYIVNFDGIVKIKVWNPGSSNINYAINHNIKYQISNNQITWTDVYSLTSSVSNQTASLIDYELDSISYRVTGTTNYYLRVLLTLSVTPASPTLVVNCYNTISTKLSISSDKMVFGNTWNIARNLPDIKQIDLLKYVCVLGGWTFSKIENTNEIVFKKFSEIVSGIENAQDLSEYLESYEILDYHSEFAQLNRLKYDNDTTVKLTTGEGLFTIDDNTLEKETDVYTAPFAASSMENFITPLGASVQVGKLPHLKDDLTWEKINFRIFHLTLETLMVYYRALSTTSLVTSKFVAKFTASDLHFSNVLVKNYANYLDIVSDFKIISGKIYMTSQRFEALDLLNPVYIQQLGSHFYIQKAGDFVRGQLCEIILIKI